MSARPGVYISRRDPAPSPPAPNATQPGITAEIRVYWPPGTPPGKIFKSLALAYVEAMDQITTTVPATGVGHHHQPNERIHHG